MKKLLLTGAAALFLATGAAHATDELNANELADRLYKECTEQGMFPGSIGGCLLESVRKHQAGLQSFRSMRRIEASRRNASALRLRFSQSFASLPHRLSQAKVR